MKFRYLFFAVVPCAALFFFGCHQKAVEAAPEPEAKVEGNRVILPEKSPALVTLKTKTAEPSGMMRTRLNGRIVWNDDLTVRVFAPFAGRVEKILVESSQHVAAGDSLALIASPDFAQAQSDVSKAQADAALAERSLERLRTLFEHGAAAEKDVRSAEADLARTRSEKDRAESALRMRGGVVAGNDSFFPLKSHIAGFVVERNINPGQEVRPDAFLANAPQFFAPLFVVSDPTHLWVLIDATERDLAVLKPGTSFTVQAPAFPDKTFTGKLDWVSDGLDATTRMVRVRGRIENPDRLLKAEMFVMAEFEAQGAPGSDVPTSAVFMKGEKHFLYVETGQGVYERREVQTGPQQGETILIVQGVKTGERVVVEGGLLLDEILLSNGT